MAEVELTLTDAQIQALLLQDGGLARVVEVVLNRVLESEMTEHVGAAPNERSSTRRGQRSLESIEGINVVSRTSAFAQGSES